MYFQLMEQNNLDHTDIAQYSSIDLLHIALLLASEKITIKYSKGKLSVCFALSYTLLFKKKSITESLRDA